MAGTFCLGDYLTIKVVVSSDIRPGDIIFFRKSENKEIVHRVMSIKKDGILTRGDNNSKPDLDLVTEKEFVGIVTQVTRRGKCLPIVGGYPGLIWASLVHQWNKIKLVIIFVGRYPYRWLRRFRLLSFCWKPRLTEVHLNTGYGPLVKYLYKRETVAYWWPNKHYFKCHKPYDLVIPNPEKSKPN